MRLQAFQSQKIPSYFSSDSVQKQAREETYFPNSALNLGALKKGLNSGENLDLKFTSRMEMIAAAQGMK